VSDAPAAGPPSLAEARAWVGLGLDDLSGRRAGRVGGIYVDAESGEPAWLVVALGPQRRGLFGLGRRNAKSVIVPVRECAAMPGRAWTAEPLDAVRGAPAVDPARPLLREHEEAICSHYEIGERVGRHAEVAGRAGGTVTAQPA